jgi:hypothetical protein
MIVIRGKPYINIVIHNPYASSADRDGKASNVTHCSYQVKVGCERKLHTVNCREKKERKTSAGTSVIFVEKNSSSQWQTCGLAQTKLRNHARKTIVLARHVALVTVDRGSQTDMKRSILMAIKRKAAATKKRQQAEGIDCRLIRGKRDSSHGFRPLRFLPLRYKPTTRKQPNSRQRTSPARHWTVDFQAICNKREFRGKSSSFQSSFWKTRSFQVLPRPEIVSKIRRKVYLAGDKTPLRDIFTSEYLECPPSGNCGTFTWPFQSAALVEESRVWWLSLFCQLASMMKAKKNLKKKFPKKNFFKKSSKSSMQITDILCIYLCLCVCLSVSE